MDKVCFEFHEAGDGSEPRLRLESSLRAQAVEIQGKEAEKIWKKVRDIVEDFPSGPIIMGGLVGR